MRRKGGARKVANEEERSIDAGIATELHRQSRPGHQQYFQSTATPLSLIGPSRENQFNNIQPRRETSRINNLENARAREDWQT